MKYHTKLIIILTAFILIATGCERKVTEEVTNTISPDAVQYVGSDACSACHVDIYNNFMRSGHPYKLNEAEDAQLPIGQYYPFTEIPRPPTNYTWDDVDKVIGGFWWKARFIRPSGAIITGPDVQYNFETGGWVGYHDGEDKPYDCGPCHMTNYVDTGNHEGHDSLIGTWTFGGVHCEECHGPGELHAASPYTNNMEIDRSADACGKCHQRPDSEYGLYAIPASKGFIKHHEQWNEMLTTKHASLECVDCHDPHYTLHPSASPFERDMAIRLTCENCHLDETASFAATTIDDHLDAAGKPGCIDCHMPLAGKSAVAIAQYEGDIHTHLWRINTDVDAEMFNEAGNRANGYLTLEYTCLKCHMDESKSWAALHAGDAHNKNAIKENNQNDDQISSK